MHINITSSTRKHPHPADMLINCANLPNPHEVPALRPRDGRDRMVKDWLGTQPGVNEFIQQHLARIIAQQPATITTTCNAGRHRSVMVAEALAEELETRGHATTVTHRELEKGKQPRRDGMGWRHQKIRRALNAQLKDGEACWWCGRPMHREHVLHADHSTSRKQTREGRAGVPVQENCWLGGCLLAYLHVNVLVCTCGAVGRSVALLGAVLTL